MSRLRVHWEVREAEEANPGHKVCSKCNTLKPFSDFNKNKNLRHGVQCWCIQCVTPYRKERPVSKSKYIKRPDWMKPVKSEAQARRAEWAANKARLIRNGEINRIGERQSWCCCYCLRDIRNNYTADHIHPIKWGGTDAPDNIQLVCKPCNSKKNAKLHDDFVEQDLTMKIAYTVVKNPRLLMAIKSVVSN